MKSTPSPMRIAAILALTLLLAVSFGCSAKKTDPSRQDTIRKKSGKRGRIPATQRPYVINGITYYPIPSARGYAERGLASWYGKPFHGRKTSNGEIYDMYGDTAAHKTLPMNTMLLVKNLENGRSTVVRINDRGPFVAERIIDLSYTKAKQLGIISRGTARVEIVALADQDDLEAAYGPPTAIAMKPPPRRQIESRPPAPPIGRQEPPPRRPPPHPPQPLPDFDRGNFYVQVGAFEQVDQARAMAHSFARKGRDVIIQQYPAAGMNLYRVLIFASHSLSQAKAYHHHLQQSGFRYTLLLAR
ncbi:MAG: septal ring lytic transglycosylase RlpA family protein [Desulfobulbus sp.]|jgi:rare lipoprotein A